MVKPCPEDPAKCRCHICHLFKHDDRYRKLWGGDGPATPRPEYVPKLITPGKFMPTTDDLKTQTIDRAKRRCIYLGAQIQEQEVRCGKIPLYVCEVYDQCRKVGCNDDGTQICATCPTYTAEDARTTEQWVAALTGPEPVTDGSLYTNKQTNAIHRILDELRGNLPKLPSFASERGIVTSGGGRYWPGTWVTAAIARAHGWRHPIVAWYLGAAEFDAYWIAKLQELDVVCVDAYEVRKQHPCRILNGFEIKSYAMIHSGIEQPIWLDSDCYPCRDLNELYECRGYRSTGSVQYPDLSNADPWTRWRQWGVAEDGSPPIETGQYLLNLRTVWEEAQIALKLNEMSDVTYHWDYGDKGPMRVAWALTKRRRTIYEKVPRWKGPAFIHIGPDDEPMFIHRCRGKVKLGDAAFYTPQHGNGLDLHDIPGEAEFQYYLAKARELALTQPNQSTG